MRAPLATAPTWVVAAVEVVILAVSWGAWSMIADDAGWQGALTGGLIFGVVCTVLSLFFGARERRGITAVLKPLTAEQRRQATRAAERGTGPGDPAARSAAVAIISTRLESYERHKTITVVVLAVFAAGSAVAAIAGDLWAVPGALLLAGGVIWALRYDGQLTRRLEKLEPPDALK